MNINEYASVLYLSYELDSIRGLDHGQDNYGICMKELQPITETGHVTNPTTQPWM